MLSYTIKNKIEQELTNYIRICGKSSSLSRISPLLLKNIKNFALRKGKRVRPLLFVLGYLGFAKKLKPNLYKTAISFELLHDFMLVHDDIVDKSDKRRGKPSMHKMLGNYLDRFKKLKFNGQDLAIIAGDTLYALALDAFLSIKEDARRKEKALRQFIQAATYTAMGEFTELLTTTKSIAKVTQQDIYRIYDCKTACYTFACPLSCGAILAGANQNQTNRLYNYGMYLGRAFQIQDDILSIFSNEKEIGKSALTDLQEAKKTLLLWHAYNNSGQKNKLIIRRILSKDKVARPDLLKMRKIITASGALDFSRKEISNLVRKAKTLIKSSRMRAKYKNLLNSYSAKLFSL